MRPLEILTPIVLAIYLGWPFTGRRRPLLVSLLPAAALIVIAIHASTEGTRWQMIPIYLVAGCALLIQIRSSLRTTDSGAPGLRGTRIAWLLTSLGLLALSTALPLLLPVPSIPVPGGAYNVGTMTFELTDSSRAELYSGRDEPRRFQIQVWYPADATAPGERAPWMAQAEVFAPAIATYIDMPSFFLNHLALVRIPAFKDAPAATAESGFPVILFSHGWNGFSAQNTGQALQLASHGYVVIGIQHTYGAVVTVFEDGTIARNNPAALPRGAPDEEYMLAARKLADQWAGDMAFVLDVLAVRNSSVRSPFAGSLDLSRVGVYGHSTGGGAAIQFCGSDPRCDAVLGMDPFMRPVSQEVLEHGVTVPSFYMFSQRWADEADSLNNQLFQLFYAHLPEPRGVISIQGTSHYDFTDLPLLSPLAPSLGLKGPISGRHVTRIVDDYLVAFFDMALKHGSPELFTGRSSKYGEIRFIH